MSLVFGKMRGVLELGAYGPYYVVGSALGLEPALSPGGGRPNKRLLEVGRVWPYVFVRQVVCGEDWEKLAEMGLAGKAGSFWEIGDFE